MKRKVAISGGFDPPHIGHIRYFKGALNYINNNDELFIILTRDDQLIKKKQYCYMTYAERVEELTFIFQGKGITVKIVPNIDKDITSTDSLRLYKPDLFLKGGDTWNIESLPEKDICEALRIKVIFGVGGLDKPQSSSILAKEYKEDTWKKQQ